MDVGEDRAAEAHFHTMLIARGVPVPYVLHFESFAPEDGRAAMLTGEMRANPWQSAAMNWTAPG